MNVPLPQHPDRLVPLSEWSPWPSLYDTDRNLRSFCLPLSITWREGRGERPNATQADIASPLPSHGRGVRGEGSPTLDSQPCLDFISSDETLDRYSEIIS